MSKTYEEMLHDAFCKCMQENHGKDWIDRYDSEEQENMRREFYSGAEWFKNLFPMMYFPPCTMPEDRMGITKSEGEETIVATTHDYIIFIGAMTSLIVNTGRGITIISGDGK